MAVVLNTAQQFIVDRMRSMLSMRTALATGSSYILDAKLGDEELWEDARLGINFFNTYPPQLTTYNYTQLYNASLQAENNGGDPLAPDIENIESILITPVIMSSLFFTGMRLQWFEAGKHFRYNDNGISIERVKQQDYANIVNGNILQYITGQLVAVKSMLAFKKLRPAGSFSGTVGFPRSLTRGLRGTRLGYGG